MNKAKILKKKYLKNLMGKMKHYLNVKKVD